MNKLTAAFEYGDKGVEIPYRNPVPGSGIFKVPESGTYYQCKHDYQTDLWGGKTRVLRLPMPETVPTLDKDQFIPLSRKWQEFWFELLVWSACGTMTGAELLEAWASLTADKRAFTDRHAVQNGYCDFILGKNMGAKPIAIKALSCGGNIVEVVYGQGGTRLNFLTLNGSEDPPKVSDVWGNHSLIHWATEITSARLADHSYVVGRFPQLKGRGVPYPFMSTDGLNSTWANRLERVENGATWSPYNPASA